MCRLGRGSLHMRLTPAVICFLCVRAAIFPASRRPRYNPETPQLCSTMSDESENYELLLGEMVRLSVGFGLAGMG